MTLVSSTGLVTAIESEIQRAENDLKGVDENLRRLTGRDFNQPIQRGERRFRPLGARDDEPPAKRRSLPGGIFARLGAPVLDGALKERNDDWKDEKRESRERRVLDGALPRERDEFPRQKPLVPSTVARPVVDGKSRTEAVAEQTTDRASRDRNRRMFSSLLGTLHRFKKDEDKHKGKEVQRAAIEHKLEEKGRAEKEEMRKERQNLIQRRMERQARIRKLEFNIARVKQHEAWEEHQRSLCNFIRTVASPPIFWMPKKHTSRTIKLVETTRDTIEGELEEERIRLKDELAGELGVVETERQFSDIESDSGDEEESLDNEDGEVEEEFVERIPRRRVIENDQLYEEDMQDNNSDFLDYEAEEGELVYDPVKRHMAEGKKRTVGGVGERMIVQVKSENTENGVSSARRVAVLPPIVRRVERHSLGGGERQVLEVVETREERKRMRELGEMSEGEEEELFGKQRRPEGPTIENGFHTKKIKKEKKHKEKKKQKDKEKNRPKSEEFTQPLPVLYASTKGKRGLEAGVSELGSEFQPLIIKVEKDDSPLRKEPEKEPEKKSPEKKSSEMKSSEMKSSEMKSSEKKPSEKKSSEKKSSEKKSSEKKSSEKKSSEKKSSEKKSSEKKSSEKKSFEKKILETKSIENKITEIEEPEEIWSEDLSHISLPLEPEPIIDVRLGLEGEQPDGVESLLKEPNNMANIVENNASSPLKEINAPCKDGNKASELSNHENRIESNVVLDGLESPNDIFNDENISIENEMHQEVLKNSNVDGKIVVSPSISTPASIVEKSPEKKIQTPKESRSKDSRRKEDKDKHKTIEKEKSNIDMKVLSSKEKLNEKGIREKSRVSEKSKTSTSEKEIPVEQQSSSARVKHEPVDKEVLKVKSSEKMKLKEKESIESKHGDKVNKEKEPTEKEDSSDELEKKEKADKERKERHEKEKKERERKDKERKERKERELKEKEQKERDKKEKELREKLKREKERKEKELREKERKQEKERKEKERKELELKEKERKEKELKEKERKEKEMREKKEKELKEKERNENELKEREKKSKESKESNSKSDSSSRKNSKKSSSKSKPKSSSKSKGDSSSDDSNASDSDESSGTDDSDSSDSSSDSDDSSNESSSGDSSDSSGSDRGRRRRKSNDDKKKRSKRSGSYESSSSSSSSSDDDSSSSEDESAKRRSDSKNGRPSERKSRKKRDDRSKKVTEKESDKRSGRADEKSKRDDGKHKRDERSKRRDKR